VHSLCLAALGQREDAEDAVQQVFIRAWRSHTSFDPQRPLGGWLTGIARRVIADSYAARSRRQRVSESAATALSYESVEPAPQIVDRVVVHEALERLGPPQDEILRMVYVQDLPQRQVAERLGMPVGTVKSHVHRGLARLRRALEVHDG
jgi:RNA polymerase sigma factor (sigma-70 family)